MKFIPLKSDEVEFRICLEDEYTRPEDDFELPEDAAYVREQMATGNPFAWCCIRVEAVWGPYHACDYLGGCSYESERDFRVGGYYRDMCERALDTLNAKLEDIVSTLAIRIQP